MLVRDHSRSCLFCILASSTEIFDFFLAHELSLAEGLRLERTVFHGLFATNDQKEGEPSFSVH